MNNSIESTHIRTCIGLSCAFYTNQGGTYEMYKEVIEGITDPFSGRGLKLSCDQTGINGNPAVTFVGQCPAVYVLYDMIDEIEDKICT
jgi:hypothetical protein